MPRLATLAVLGALAIQANAFSFSYTSPVQCGDLTVTWTGGTAPFYLFVTPFFSTLQNISIPDSSFNGTHGSFTSTLRITGTENRGRFLLTMSDATGVGSGGTSGVLTVGTGNGTCDTTDHQPPFTYALERSLQQCRTYSWTDYSNAIQPVTITGLIPLGKTFTLNPPRGSSYDWITNIASGTNVAFSMVDAQGRQGGVTDLYTVSSSDDSTCITSDSPSSTAQSTTAAVSTSTASSTPSSTSSSGNAAVIGSSIAGGTVFLVAVASLIWFFIRKNTKHKRDFEDESSMQGINGLKRRGQSVDLLPDDQSGHSGPGAIARYPLPSPMTGEPLQHERGRNVYDPDPYVLPPSDSHSYFPPSGDRGSTHDTESTALRHTRVTSHGTSTTGMSKAQMAAASTSGSVRGPQRFVLHTDAGEVDDDEVVELPPMYSQVLPRRGSPSTTSAPTESDRINDPLRS